MAMKKAKRKPKAALPAVQNVDTNPVSLADLHPAQAAVLRMIAQWEPPRAIKEALTEAFRDGTLTEAWLYKVSAEACRPAWARPIVERFRKEFLAARDTIACRHAAYRMRQLQRIIEYTVDDRTRLAAIKEAFEQSGDKVERVADVSDQESIARIVEQLEQAGKGDSG